MRVPSGEKRAESIVPGAVSSLRRAEPSSPAMNKSAPLAKIRLLPGAQATDRDSIPGTSRTEADAKSMMRRVERKAYILWGTKRSWEPSGEMSAGRKPRLEESNAAGVPPLRG